MKKIGFLLVSVFLNTYLLLGQDLRGTMAPLVNGVYYNITAEVPVDIVIENIGTVGAPSSTVDYYISDNPTLFAPGSMYTKLGTDQVNSLAPGVDTDENGYLTIPYGYRGQAWLIALVDANGVTGDVNLSNNTPGRMIYINDHDLSGSLRLHGGTIKCPGDLFSLELEVDNVGQLSSWQVGADYYVSDSPDLFSSGSDYELLASDLVQGLSPGAQADENAYNLTIPQRFTGELWIIAKIGDPSSYPDVDISNNYPKIKVNIADVDLTISNISLNSTRFLPGGEVVSIDATIQNLGNVSLGVPIKIDFYLNNQRLWTNTISSIGANSSVHSILNAQLPSSAIGAKNIIVKVDTDSEVCETNEQNNESSKGISIGYPDYKLGSYRTLSGSTHTGSDCYPSYDMWEDNEGMFVTFAVENNGITDGKATSKVGIYFSEDNSFNINDDRLIATETLSPINQGTFSNFVTAIVVGADIYNTPNLTWSSVSGVKYIVIVADKDDDIFEGPGGEGNNIVAIPFCYRAKKSSLVNPAPFSSYDQPQWIGQTNVNITSGNSIVKTGGDGWNAGTSTCGSLPAYTDGGIAYTVDNYTNSFAIGLNEADLGTGLGDLDYAMYFIWNINNSNRRVRILQNGTTLETEDPYNVGDEYRIERVGDSIFYLKRANGTSTFSVLHRLQGDITKEYLGDVAIYYSNATITDLRSNFGSEFICGGAEQMLKRSSAAAGGSGFVDNSDTTGFAFAVSVFPNPAKDNVTVQIEDNLLGNVSVSLRMLSLNGACVYAEEVNLENKGIGTITIDVSILPSGIYLLEYGSNGKIQHQKVIVE